MAVKSITRRWLLNSFSIILVILIVAVVAASLSLRSYYYNSVRQAIDSRVRVVSNLVLKYSDGDSSQLDSEIQKYVENFCGSQFNGIDGVGSSRTAAFLPPVVFS